MSADSRLRPEHIADLLPCSKFSAEEQLELAKKICERANRNFATVIVRELELLERQIDTQSGIAQLNPKAWREAAMLSGAASAIQTVRGVILKNMVKGHGQN